MIFYSGALVIIFSIVSLHECKTSGAPSVSSHGVHGGVRRFPDGFMFGTATAAYQVEGAWDEDGKSENIWDHSTHQVPSPIRDRSSGDIAADSYHQYKRDVEMMRELGLDYYRFSFSWARILPTSFPDHINQVGVSYYNNLINEMLKYNIQPLVTIYHWELPQKLQDLGGWTNPNIVDWFSDYARIAFKLFGDRVKYWITVNEPREVCYSGYAAGKLAPFYTYSGMADYLCSKNVLLAHAKAYHIYNEEFRSSQGGNISIAINANWYEPASEDHVDAAKEASMLNWGQYAHPIFSETGDYPPLLKERVAAKSAAQGFTRSRLPEFTAEEVNYVKGTSDYFSLIHYTTYMAYRNESDVSQLFQESYAEDIGVLLMYPKDEWILSKGRNGTRYSFVQSVPWGFYKVLSEIRETYNNPIVFIAENGFGTLVGLDDDDRVAYYRAYLDALLDAVADGSNIIGYTAWSFMDVFEWKNGYTKKFGMYEVDFSSPLRTRTPRKSAFVYKEMLRTRELDHQYQPNTTVMSIQEGH